MISTPKTINTSAWDPRLRILWDDLCRAHAVSFGNGLGKAFVRSMLTRLFNYNNDMHELLRCTSHFNTKVMTSRERESSHPMSRRSSASSISSRPFNSETIDKNPMGYDTTPDLCFHSCPFLNDYRYTLLVDIKSGDSPHHLKRAYVQLVSYAMALYANQTEEVVQQGNKIFVLLLITSNQFLVALFRPQYQQDIIFKEFAVFKHRQKARNLVEHDCSMSMKSFLSFLAALDTAIFQAKSFS